MASESDEQLGLLKKLEAGDATECEHEILKLKSDVYKSITLIFDKNKKVYQGYVRCKLALCRKIIKHDIHKSGTSHLQKHVNSAPTTHGNYVSPVAAGTSQQKMTGFLTQRKLLNDVDKTEVRRAMSYFCSTDLRPFSCIEGKGFKRIAQTFIQIGAKYGNIPADEVIPSRTVVSEFCQSEAKADRDVFVTQVNAFIERHGMIGVTTDMWQDSFKKKNYVAVTVHMIQNGTLLSRVLQVYQFPLDENKTAANIRTSLQEMAKKLGIKDDITHFFFVTDQGSNIKAALSSNYQRIPCACHCLSTALKHALPGGPGDKG
jgi:hypothetical protein